jgi:hypothetical protein
MFVLLMNGATETIAFGFNGACGNHALTVVRTRSFADAKPSEYPV